MMLKEKSKHKEMHRITINKYYLKPIYTQNIYHRLLPLLKKNGAVRAISDH